MSAPALQGRYGTVTLFPIRGWDSKGCSLPAGNFQGFGEKLLPGEGGCKGAPKLQWWRKLELSVLVLGKQGWVLFWRGWEWCTEKVGSREKPKLAATAAGREA